MGKKINVILITGFLGSGKTTFLNQIIKIFPENLKLMVLMNEFGEIGLDGTLIESDELDILEINKGSIFCVCVKTDFIRSLNEITQTIKPDILVIESTGVANPSDLKKDLNLSIFQNRFQLLEQVCLIDADCFVDAYNTFVSVEKQIAASTLFIINKKDLASGQTISKIKSIIEKHHPSPEFFETSFADIPLERFIPKPDIDLFQKTEKDNIPILPDKFEHAIDKILETFDPDAAPPDRLVSAVYLWRGKSIESFEKILSALPKQLVRAKGFLSQDKTIFLFNLTMGQKHIERYDPGKDIQPLLNRLVFIGPPDAIEKLNQLHRECPDLIQNSIFDPMANTSSAIFEKL